jgi:hypothetical protein
VIAATEEGRRGRTDAWHFREALADQRIILTWDKRDFEYLHRLWTTLRIMGVVTRGHLGILTKEAPRSFREADWIQLAVERLETPGDFGGRMFVWHQHTGRWEEDQWKPEE